MSASVPAARDLPLYERADAYLAPPGRPPVTDIAFIGLGTMGMAGIGLAVWSAIAPIASAAIAPGTVVVDSMRKTVQHVEGGAIAELLVRDGDRVQAGQVLVRLDDLEARALHEVLEGRFLALSAQVARLRAEREEREAVTFPEVINARRGEPKAAEILRAQDRIFVSGREALQGQLEVLRQRIASLKAQAAALQAQLKSAREQHAIIQEELAAVRDMVAKGLERRPRLFSLERTSSDLVGQQGNFQNRIAQIDEQVAGAEMEMLNARRARVEKASLELRDAETQLSEVAERLGEARAKLGRRDVVAPQPGTVLDLNYHTVGGVIPPGGKILELVPEKDRLIVEARIKPTDIDVVHADLPTKIALSAYKSRITPQLNGRVLQVSADVLSDDRRPDRAITPATNHAQHYFVARVEIEPAELERLPDVRLAPGMPVEVFIQTGERTLIAYLVQPLVDSFRRAFREE